MSSNFHVLLRGDSLQPPARNCVCVCCAACTESCQVREPDVLIQRIGTGSWRRAETELDQEVLPVPWKLLEAHRRSKSPRDVKDVKSRLVSTHIEQGLLPDIDLSCIFPKGLRESNERDASANRVRPRRPTHCPLHSPEFAAFPQLLRKLRALLSRRDTCEKESEVRSENHSKETYLGAWTYLHISAQSPPLRSPGRGQGHWGATMSGR